jgi:hypothetical protein
MAVLSEGHLQFIFGSSCLAEKYDEWSFYRNQFQSTCSGVKAVDMICVSNNTSWLIEIKDYRQHNPSLSLKLTITHNFNKLKFLFFLSWHYRFFIINNRLAFTYRIGFDAQGSIYSFLPRFRLGCCPQVNSFIIICRQGNREALLG